MADRKKMTSPQEAAIYLRLEAAHLASAGQPNHAGWHADCAELLESYAAHLRYMDEVLNSGDGVYRP